MYIGCECVTMCRLLHVSASALQVSVARIILLSEDIILHTEAPAEALHFVTCNVRRKRLAAPTHQPFMFAVQPDLS